MKIEDISKYVLWTHIYQPLVNLVRDTRSDYFGKYWILQDNENINGAYLTFEELVEFWDSHPGWREEIVKPRFKLTDL